MSFSEKPTFTLPPDFILFNKIIEKLDCNADELFTWMCQDYFGDIFFATYQNRNRPYKLDNDEREKMLKIQTSLLQTGKPFSEFEMNVKEKLPTDSIGLSITIKRENLSIKTNSLNSFIANFNVDETNSQLHIICEIYKFLNTDQNITLPPEFFIALDLWKRIFITNEIENPPINKRSVALEDKIKIDASYLEILGGRNTRSDTPGVNTAITRIARVLNSTPKNNIDNTISI